MPPWLDSPASRRLLASLWTAAILAAILCPARWLPADEKDTSSGHEIPHADKIIHFSLFAAFGFLWTRAAGRSRWQAVLLAGAVTAVASELGQMIPFVDRDADVWDALADVSGAVTGVFLFLILSNIPLFISSRASPSTQPPE